MGGQAIRQKQETIFTVTLLLQVLHVYLCVISALCLQIPSTLSKQEYHYSVIVFGKLLLLDALTTL